MLGKGERGNTVGSLSSGYAETTLDVGSFRNHKNGLDIVHIGLFYYDLESKITKWL